MTVTAIQNEEASEPSTGSKQGGRKPRRVERPTPQQASPSPSPAPSMTQRESPEIAPPRTQQSPVPEVNLVSPKQEDDDSISHRCALAAPQNLSIATRTPHFALQRFVSMIVPPQPGLVAVLENAGLRSWAELQMIATNEYVREEVLGSLLREQRVTRMQYALMKDALRSCVSA